MIFGFDQTRQTPQRSISRQMGEGCFGFAQTIETSKFERWFGLTGNQDCNRTKGTSFITIRPQLECNLDCFDYEKNAMKELQVELRFESYNFEPKYYFRDALFCEF